MPDLLERLKSALADRYALEEAVGSGGMATVYRAEDLKHHRNVALKILHPELTATLGAERFLQEIEIIARLDNPPAWSRVMTDTIGAHAPPDAGRGHHGPDPWAQCPTTC